MRFISLKSLKQINRSSLKACNPVAWASITCGLELSVLNLCWLNTTEGRPTATKRNDNPVCAAATYFGTSRYVVYFWTQHNGRTAAVKKEEHIGAGDLPEYPSKELGQATDVSPRKSWGRLGLGLGWGGKNKE